MSNRSDNFNRADTTNAIGTPSDGGSAWVQSAGTWGISTNTGYESGGLSQQNIAVLESSLSDVDVQVTVSTLGSDNGLVARFLDTAHYLLFIYTAGTGYRMFKDVGGFTQLGSTASGTGANGDVYKFSVNGSSLTGYVNGVSKITATDSAGSTNTQHGLRAFADSVVRFDNFSAGTGGSPTLDEDAEWIMTVQAA